MFIEITDIYFNVARLQLFVNLNMLKEVNEEFIINK